MRCLALHFFLWLTEKLHGIPASVVSFLPIILLTMTGIINGDDVRKLPWDTLMLVAGGLALGLAIKETGLASLLCGKDTAVSILISIVLVMSFAFLNGNYVEYYE